MNMTEEFFDFVKEPSAENYLKAQAYVVNHADYNPYSNEIDTIIKFLDENEFEKALTFKSINTILSPSAHLMKRYAATQLKDEKAASAEHVLFLRIIESLTQTGDGSVDNPYLITQMSDERDVLQFQEEKFASQRLLKKAGKSIDQIKTESGKIVHFDVTVCFNAMAKNFSIDDILEDEDESAQVQEIEEEIKAEEKKPEKEQSEEELRKEKAEENKIEEKPVKKWWKFW